MEGPMIEHLSGYWRGSGAGEFGGDSFQFDELMEFERLGALALYYRLRATSRDNGELIHTESGIWIVTGDSVTISVALPRAIEMSEGEVDEHEIRLSSTAVFVASTVSDPHLTSTTRWYRCDGATLSYDIAIGMTDTPERRHVWAELSRDSGS